jgi:hypothetical protein
MNDFNARDLFAGLAVAGWLGNARLSTPLDNKKLAANAYDIADAMLEEKEKRDVRGDDTDKYGH